MSQQTILRVDMMCGGCENAVRKVLSRQQEVHNVDVDLPSNKVIVSSNLQPQQLVDIVAKTGKKTELWS